MELGDESFDADVEQPACEPRSGSWSVRYVTWQDRTPDLTIEELSGELDSIAADITKQSAGDSSVTFSDPVAFDGGSFAAACRRLNDDGTCPAGWLDTPDELDGELMVVDGMLAGYSGGEQIRVGTVGLSGTVLHELGHWMGLGEGYGQAANSIWTYQSQDPMGDGSRGFSPLQRLWLGWGPDGLQSIDHTADGTWFRAADPAGDRLLLPGLSDLDTAAGLEAGESSSWVDAVQVTEAS